MDICPFRQNRKCVAFKPGNSFLFPRLGQRIEGKSVFGKSLVDNEPCRAETVQSAVNLTHVSLGAVRSASAGTSASARENGSSVSIAAARGGSGAVAGGAATIGIKAASATMAAIVASKREMTKAEIDAVVKAASEGALKGILGFNDKPLVSIDFNHDPHSSVYDSTLTQVMGGTLVKVCSWYDNEWGFSNRMLDTTLALMAAK